MKKRVVALFVLSFTASAIADSANTVQFRGEVSTQTCSVNINGSAANPIVLLPTVAETDLAAAGESAGETVFTVNVTNCSAAASTTAISTVFVGNNVTTSGNLGNSGGADNVSIQLLDSDGSTPLTFSTDAPTSTTAMTMAIGETAVSQELVARYYAEGTGVSAGSVIATAQFAVSYQ